MDMLISLTVVNSSQYVYVYMYNNHIAQNCTYNFCQSYLKKAKKRKKPALLKNIDAVNFNFLSNITVIHLCLFKKSHLS